MGFILGILLGGMLAGDGHPPAGSMLAEIPFRCFAALDMGDAAYVECRRLSMAAQLTQQYNSSQNFMNGVDGASGLTRAMNDALALELKALRALEVAAKARKPAP